MLAFPRADIEGRAQGMTIARKRPGLGAADRERYHWLLEQFRSAPIGGDGHRIFDARFALPPAKTIEESIDLARQPFVACGAETACWIPITRNRSKLTVTACEPVQCSGYEGFKFGVHFEPGNRFRWHVTEFTTGLSVTNHCPTRDAAVAKASERLGKDQPKYFQQKLDSAREHAYDQAKRRSGQNG